MQSQEALLQAAGAYQETVAVRAQLREGVVAEHWLARLGQLGMGQARYHGRAKTKCQLVPLATITNLRRVCQWVAAQGAKHSTPGSTPLAAAA